MSLELTNDYKYITMIHAESKPKTEVFAVMTKDQEVTLGVIKWYAPWRQYCFLPDDNTIYSKGCMNDINDFIGKLGDMRKGSQSHDSVKESK